MDPDKQLLNKRLDEMFGEQIEKRQIIRFSDLRY